VTAKINPPRTIKNGDHKAVLCPSNRAAYSLKLLTHACVGRYFHIVTI
jgi:hypothetical protein